MSKVIYGGRTVGLFRGLWLLSMLVVFIFLMVLLEKPLKLSNIGVLSLYSIIIFVLVGVALGWEEIPRRINAVVRFSNVRDALNSGYLVIVTNEDSRMRCIADEVSKCLSRLGVSHYLAKEYVKHLVVEGQDAFYRARLDDIASHRPDKCKLNLVLSAINFKRLGSGSDRGIRSVRYGLVDNGYQSVIKLDFHLDSHSDDWPSVSFSDRKVPTPNVIAKAIVEDMFRKINLTIWAVPPSTK